MEYFACGVRVRQWKTSDILAVEHKKWPSKEKDIMEYFACGLRVRWKTSGILAVERKTWS